MGLARRDALFVLAAVAVLATATRARVWTTVYRYDEKTPLEMVEPNHPRVYRAIMAGTHLTIVVSSDQTGYWFGSLIVDGASLTYGALQARGPVNKPRNYAGSCLYAAGDAAWVEEMADSAGEGFQFNSTHASPTRRGAVPGDWFILDYYARKTGTCQVQLFDYDLDFLMPVETSVFTQVPARDFNADNIVDLRDFSLLAAQWQSALSPDPNDRALAMDLDADGAVGAIDLMLFTDFWLERTDAPRPVVDPNGK